MKKNQFLIKKIHKELLKNHASEELIKVLIKIKKNHESIISEAVRLSQRKGFNSVMTTTVLKNKSIHSNGTGNISNYLIKNAEDSIKSLSATLEDLEKIYTLKKIKTINSIDGSVQFIFNCTIYSKKHFLKIEQKIKEHSVYFPLTHKTKQIKKHSNICVILLVNWLNRNSEVSFSRGSDFIEHISCVLNDVFPEKELLDMDSLVKLFSKNKIKLQLNTIRTEQYY